jgi:hypothetical protein
VNIGKILFGTGLALSLTGAASVQCFSQAPGVVSRIPQQIIINGQLANGAYVRNRAGGMQSFQCPNPQPYTTPGGASSGWACFEPSTGTYILSALPPRQTQVQAPLQAQVPDQPAVPADGTPYPSYPKVGYEPFQGHGHVKIEVNIKSGSIYVDGGFAGSIGKSKKLTLPAGNHDIEVRDASSRTVLKERVQVLTGKTVDIKHSN